MANQLSIASGIQGFDLNAVRLYEREKLIRYNVTLSGSYTQHVRGSNVGEVIDLTKNFTLAGQAYNPEQYWGYKGPSRVYVLNTGNTGYSMSIVPGADLLHWLLVIYSTYATELAAGTYAANAAALLTDQDIIIEASGRNFD
jgi:hypothetical protein